MAITKVLARKGWLDTAVAYVLNGDKTEDRILTDSINCDPGHEARQMADTKRELSKEDGVQYYHMIQSTPTQRGANTAGFWRCTPTTSMCWGKSKSGNTRRA